MSLLASDIVTPARSTLLDAAGVAFTNAEMIDWLNMTLMMIASMKPDFIPKDTNITLAAGVKQSLPADGLLLLNVFRDGEGGFVRIVPIDEYVRVHPSWVDDTPGPVHAVLYDPRIPTVFYVHPPAVASVALNIQYGAVPTAVTALSDALTGVPDRFRAALHEGLLGFAYAKNSLKQDTAKSEFHTKRCQQMVAGDKMGMQSLSAAPDGHGARQ